MLATSLFIALALQVTPAAVPLTDNSADLDAKFSALSMTGLNSMSAAYAKWTIAGKAWPTKAREALPKFLQPVAAGYMYCSGVALRDRLFHYEADRAIELAMSDCEKMRKVVLLVTKYSIQASNPSALVADDAVLAPFKAELVKQLPRLRVSASGVNTICRVTSPVSQTDSRTLLWSKLRAGMSPYEACKSLILSGVRVHFSTDSKASNGLGLDVLDGVSVNDSSASVSLTFTDAGLRSVSLLYSSSKSDFEPTKALLREKYGNPVESATDSDGGVAAFSRGDLSVLYLLVSRKAQRGVESIAALNYSSVADRDQSRSERMKRLRQGL